MNKIDNMSAEEHAYWEGKAEAQERIKDLENALKQARSFIINCKTDVCMCGVAIDKHFPRISDHEPVSQHDRYSEDILTLIEDVLEGIHD